MPKLKAEDLRSLSIDELVERSEHLRKELFDLRFQVKLAKLENFSKIKQTKRNLAKVLTIKREMELKKS
jgi:large subunit ribosomal protein L29